VGCADSPGGGEVLEDLGAKLRDVAGAEGQDQISGLGQAGNYIDGLRKGSDVADIGFRVALPRNADELRRSARRGPQR
jgi:hypothetical protein